MSGARSFEQRFMKSGHSFLPNDADFGVIERVKERQEVFVPSQWMDVVRRTRTKNPFSVIEIGSTDFVSLQEWGKNKTVNRKKTQEGHKVQWLQIQCLRFEAERPFIMKFKYTLGDLDWYEVDFTWKVSARSRPEQQELVPQVLYPD
jgi:hypothetical protein